MIVLKFGEIVVMDLKSVVRVLKFNVQTKAGLLVCPKQPKFCTDDFSLTTKGLFTDFFMIYISIRSFCEKV